MLQFSKIIYEKDVVVLSKTEGKTHGEIIIERLDLLEKKINSVYNVMDEMQKLMNVFLDNLSGRKDVAGTSVSKPDKETPKEKKELYVFHISEVPENKRPPNWNYEIKKGDSKFTLWDLFQTSEGRKHLQTINVKSVDDLTGDKKDFAMRMQKKIREFHKPAKEVYMSLMKAAKAKENNT